MKKRLFITLLMAVLMPFMMQAQSNASYSEVQHKDTCGSYTWSLNGQTYTESGVYAYFTQTHDTLYVLDLTIYPVYNTPVNVVPIDGGCTYTWGDTTLAAAGTYTRKFQSSHGCDSMASIILTLSSSASASYTVTACDSYIWKNDTLTSSTVISNRTFVDPNGLCDSVLSLNLTILTPTAISHHVNVSKCDTIKYKFTNTWQNFTQDTVVSSEQYATPGSAYWRYFHKREANQAQCYDSVLYTHLNVRHSTNVSIVDPKVCDQYRLAGTYFTYKYNYDVNESGDTTNTTIDTIAHDYDTIFSNNISQQKVKVGVNSQNCDSNYVLTLTIYKSPVAVIEGDINLRPNTSTTLFATCDQNVNFKWFNAQNTQISTADSIVTDALSENTDFSLVAINASTQCTDTTKVTVMVNEGIADANSSTLKLYPNPATTQISLECVEGIDNIAIYNVMGQRVMQSYNMTSNTLNLGHLANGTYVLRVQLKNGQVEVRNFVIAR